MEPLVEFGIVVFLDCEANIGRFGRAGANDITAVKIAVNVKGHGDPVIEEIG